MLKIKKEKLNELGIYLRKLNIMDDMECIYTNVYCAVKNSDLEFIKNSCVNDYDVQFFINENNEFDYCTWPENRDEEFILDTLYDLTINGLVEKVKE